MVVLWVLVGIAGAVWLLLSCYGRHMVVVRGDDPGLPGTAVIVREVLLMRKASKASRLEWSSVLVFAASIIGLVAALPVDVYFIYVLMQSHASHPHAIFAGFLATILSGLLTVNAYWAHYLLTAVIASAFWGATVDVGY